MKVGLCQEERDTLARPDEHSVGFTVILHYKAVTLTTHWILPPIHALRDNYVCRDLYCISCCLEIFVKTHL